MAASSEEKLDKIASSVAEFKEELTTFKERHEQLANLSYKQYTTIRKEQESMAKEVKEIREKQINPVDDETLKDVARMTFEQPLADSDDEEREVESEGGYSDDSEEDSDGDEDESEEEEENGDWLYDLLVELYEAQEREKESDDSQSEEESDVEDEIEEVETDTEADKTFFIATLFNNKRVKEEIPAKCEDPGPCLVTCRIKHAVVRECLCDAGACSSVMPYELYKFLGLGPLKKCNTPKPINQVPNMFDQFLKSYGQTDTTPKY
ncbi:hypothetical protein PIB30_065745 [Stylosanthes scabra]|uniref:Uncharacterized protein n=1 Tax=Stylosanthes scabra TaxID=79078 RepID=A0ABU6TLW1_9FABA|nr:hypothetical protein [Stylosanthes scabra]